MALREVGHLVISTCNLQSGQIIAHPRLPISLGHTICEPMTGTPFLHDTLTFAMASRRSSRCIHFLPHVRCKDYRVRTSRAIIKNQVVEFSSTFGQSLARKGNSSKKQNYVLLRLEKIWWGSEKISKGESWLVFFAEDPGNSKEKGGVVEKLSAFQWVGVRAPKHDNRRHRWQPYSARWVENWQDCLFRFSVKSW